MCLGIPGKIVEVDASGGLGMGKIDFNGVTQEICLAFVPEARVGDDTILHAGFALTMINEKEAQQTLDLFRPMDAFHPAEAELLD